MEFFDKLGKKASETYKFTAEKTGKFAKEAKLRMKMNENKSDIEGLYKQIGKKVYEKHLLQDTININEELEEECTKIDILSDEIESALNEILSLKDIKQCSNCYEKIDKNSKYCPNCGDKQEEIVEENADDATHEDSDESEEQPAKEVEVIDVTNAHEKAEKAEDAKTESVNSDD